MTNIWQCGVQAGNEECRHREPRHKYWMKQNVQWKDGKGQLGEEEPNANRDAISSKKSSKMPKLHHGVGANCTILSNFIHPSEHVTTKHVNLDKDHKTSVIIVGKETVKVRRKDQKCYTFRSDDYPNIVLHAVKRYLNVVTEGPPQSFFDQSTGNDATIAEAADEVAPNMPPLARTIIVRIFRLSLGWARLLTMTIYLPQKIFLLPMNLSFGQEHQTRYSLQMDGASRARALESQTTTPAVVLEHHQTS
jgi:hypothetical protein